MNTATRTAASTLALLAAVGMFGLGGFLDDDLPTRKRERDPEESRNVTLTVVLNPARKTGIRWRLGPHGRAESTTGPVWKHRGRGWRGETAAIQATQHIIGRYAHCVIEVDDVVLSFEKSTDGRRLNCAVVLP